MDRKAGITAGGRGGEPQADRSTARSRSTTKAVTASINRGVPLLLGDRSQPPARNILDLWSAGQAAAGGRRQAEEDEVRETERPRLFGR